MASLLSVRRAAATPVHTNFQSFGLSGSKNRNKKVDRSRSNKHTHKDALERRKRDTWQNKMSSQGKRIFRERELFLFWLFLNFSSIEEKKSTGCDCGSFATESTGGLSSAHEGAAGEEEEEKVGGWTGRKEKKRTKRWGRGGSFLFFGWKEKKSASDGARVGCLPNFHTLARNTVYFESKC